MKSIVKLAILTCFFLLIYTLLITSCGKNDPPSGEHVPSVDENGSINNGNQSSEEDNKQNNIGDIDQTNPENSEENRPLTTSSIGLKYEVNSDGKTCKITGIGTCTDTEIVIGSHIDGYEVTEIDGLAFDHCTKLTSVTVFNNVTSIGKGAFRGCIGLTSITLPFVGGSKATSGIYAHPHFGYIFDAWNYNENDDYVPIGLKTVVILEGAEGIADYAFWNCRFITSLTIPDSLLYVGVDAFSTLDDCLFELDNGVEYLGEWAVGFDNSDIENIVLRDDTVGIAGNAFGNCGASSIYIPDSVKSICTMAFDGADFNNITFGSNSQLVFIGARAFQNCNQLTSITLPGGVTSIGERAFQGCDVITELNFDGTVEQWNAINFAYNWKDGSNIRKIICSDGTTT